MRAYAHILSAACMAVALAACAPTEHKPAEPPLSWPSAPSSARIAWVNAFATPEDLGISKGFFQRAAEFLFGAPNSRLIRPMAVVALDQVIYVADPGARGIHRFDPRRRDYALIQAPDGQPLPSPVGMALGAKGEVYVADSELARVFVIRPGATFAAPLALQAELHQPTALAFAPESGRLFVVEAAAHRVAIFNADGTLAQTVGTRGAGDGEFNFPTHIWRSGAGRLYVADSLNFRVQILDEQGTFVSKFGKQGDALGDIAREKGVATDQFGHVYVMDGILNAMQIFDDQGRLLLALGGQGDDRGEFWLPTGIFIGEDDMIYIADSYNRRVQVLRYIGGPA